MTKFNGSTRVSLVQRAPSCERTVAGVRALAPRCSFANPSGRRDSHEQNTNSQFVQAYRLGTQGRDINARCNQRPSEHDATESAVFLLIGAIATAAEPPLRDSGSPSDTGNLTRTRFSLQREKRLGTVWIRVTNYYRSSRIRNDDTYFIGIKIKAEENAGRTEGQ